jgi:hypothetical protein
MSRFSHEEMADELDKLLYGKTCWLADFAAGPKKRSDPEIETRQRELAVLRQAASDYRNAAERKSA